MTSANDQLETIMQTQGRNFFSVRFADDRISNPKTKIFFGESRSQSAQSSKFEIHRACVFSL